MKKIDSDALGIANRALGLSGAGSPVTELTDGVVDQSLSIGPLVRRGRTLAGSEGVLIAQFRNVHVAANSLTTIINPYAAGVRAIAPWPDPIPAQFDIWLLTAEVRRPSGTGTLSGALHLNAPATIIGLSAQGGGGLAAGVTSHTLAFWDAVGTENIDFGILNQGGTLARIGLRLPRSSVTQLVWASTSSAVATYDLYLMLGLFPIALGQDGLV